MFIRVLSFFVLCLSLTGCATSIQGLKEQNPDLEYKAKKSNLSGLSECILRKMEAYPILTGFSFEDRTIPVQIRQFADKVELFQMQNAFVLTYIDLQKVQANQIQSKLYVMNGTIHHDRTAKAYSSYIQECY